MFGRLAFIYLLSRDSRSRHSIQPAVRAEVAFAIQLSELRAAVVCGHINDVGEDPDDIGAPADSLA